MPRYWIIAPVASNDRELYDNTWKFDLANDLITMGWKELGDVSKLSKQAMLDKVAASYPDKPAQTKALILSCTRFDGHQV